MVNVDFGIVDSRSLISVFLSSATHAPTDWVAFLIFENVIHISTLQITGYPYPNVAEAVVKVFM